MTRSLDSFLPPFLPPRLSNLILRHETQQTTEGANSKLCHRLPEDGTQERAGCKVAARTFPVSSEESQGIKRGLESDSEAASTDEIKRDCN